MLEQRIRLIEVCLCFEKGVLEDLEGGAAC